ncbi:hypothetical protein OC842_007512 [Tilletia horrida]|uniref:Myb/SANT-like domain-containing protein n=1 Tax=Tilletia horrida TaxID=155126 RepID=A0AAN6G883_9BASI|nr:hypothetical protein OC842_007512 [Tilletia horrida]
MSSSAAPSPPPPFPADDSFSSAFTAASSPLDSATPSAAAAPDPTGGAAAAADGVALSKGAAAATGPCVWSSADSELMLTVLEEAAMSKLQSGGGFKPEVWRKASDRLAPLRLKGGVKGPEQVKTHFRSMKKMWTEVHDLINMSGFGWDEAQKRVTASEDVWDDLLATKDKFKKWKNRSFEYYDRLTALCIQSTATGAYAHDAGGEVDGEDNDEDEEDSDDDDLVLPTRKRKRPSAVSALGQIAEALKAMAAPAADEDDVGAVMEELLELDGDNFDVDELATLGLALAEKPKLIAMYRSLKTRDVMRLAFVRKVLATN